MLSCRAKRISYTHVAAAVSQLKDGLAQTQGLMALEQAEAKVVPEVHECQQHVCCLTN